MALTRSMIALLTVFSLAHAHRLRHKHEAIEVKKRQVGPPIQAVRPAGANASPTQTPAGVLTYITPSPGASPVAVTTQSQIVISYVPQFTLCELPPLAFFPTTPSPSAKPTTAPYHNYSISVPLGNGTCSTVYSETETMVCHTTLDGLVTSWPVSNCAEEITFSSQYGYRLVTPTPSANETTNGTYSNTTATITPAPSIHTLTTYYLAPWAELTSAGAPKDVFKKICQTFANGTEECITEYEVWHTSLATKTATETTTLNISTTIHGPSGMIVWGTYVANVTELLTTVTMETTTEKEYQTEWTTTHKSTASVSTAPTVYQTMTLEEASSTHEPTSTRTIHMTITTHVGTTTVTAASSSAET